jgi:hypothetical protein
MICPPEQLFSYLGEPAIIHPHFSNASYFGGLWRNLGY